MLKSCSSLHQHCKALLSPCARGFDSNPALHSPAVGSGLTGVPGSVSWPSQAAGRMGQLQPGQQASPWDVGTRLRGTAVAQLGHRQITPGVSGGSWAMVAPGRCCEFCGSPAVVPVPRQGEQLWAGHLPGMGGKGQKTSEPPPGGRDIFKSLDWAPWGPWIWAVWPSVFPAGVSRGGLCTLHTESVQHSAGLCVSHGAGLGSPLPVLSPAQAADHRLPKGVFYCYGCRKNCSESCSAQE